MVVLTVLYAVASIWLSVYGFNAFLLIYLYFRHRHAPVACPALDEYPVVTVQVPVYNERYVVERAIDAATGLDWPSDRLQVQVLDDSTDETAALAQARVAYHRQRGVDIVHLRRPARTGFKAGALNAAMERARGEYVAILDADFCPEPDFLQRTVPYLVARPGLAFVQARWGHLNDTFSSLTLAQAIALDGHFAVEHIARQRAGLLASFNGTGGVWRASAIRESGGWDEAQLTEDVDLAYRAQLAGWQGLTLTDVAPPAELPVQLAAFKRQQFRWAKGNIRCFLKLGAGLARARLPPLARVQALIHLSYYLAHPLMLAVVLSTLPLIALGLLGRWPLAFLSLATLGPPLLYALGQRTLYRDWPRRLRALPVLICLGLGLALNSTIAAVEALLGIRSDFERTPKFWIKGHGESWQDRTYALPAGPQVWGELALTVYAVIAAIVALDRGYALAVPFLLLYVLGFGYVGLLGILQSVRRTKR